MNDDQANLPLASIKFSKTCPICEIPTRLDYSYVEGYVETESRTVCDICGLSYTFATGTELIEIDGFGWLSHYTTNLTEQEEFKILKQQELVLHLHKKLIFFEETLTEEEMRLLDDLEKELAPKLEYLPF